MHSQPSALPYQKFPLVTKTTINIWQMMYLNLRPEALNKPHNRSKIMLLIHLKMMLPNMLATALVCLIDSFVECMGSLCGLWQWSGRKYSTCCRTLQDYGMPARWWRYEDVWRRFTKKTFMTMPNSSCIDISAIHALIQIYKTDASWRPRREKIQRDTNQIITKKR